MKKLLIFAVLSFFTFNSVNANFNLYDWNPENLKNFQSRFDWTPNKVDNVIYTYNFNEKNFKILNSEITISDWPGSPELVYKNEIFDKIFSKLWLEKTKKLFQDWTIKILWNYETEVYKKNIFDELWINRYVKKEKSFTYKYKNSEWKDVESNFKKIEERLLTKISWERKQKMKIELMNNSTSCDYHASEPDSVYNLKSLICLYDVSLLPINFNLEYKIFDKNDKKLSKELKSWKRNLEIKYEFVKKEGKYFYRPFVELDLDLSKESKNDDFVELKFSYERFNYWAY